MSDPSKFLHALTHLHRAPTKFCKAPHKPVLLITLLELIESGYANDNHFYPDTELVGVFQENWWLLVDTANQPDFTQPFYYLQSEKIDGSGYWELIAMPGWKKVEIYFIFTYCFSEIMSNLVLSVAHVFHIKIAKIICSDFVTQNK